MPAFGGHFVLVYIYIYILDVKMELKLHLYSITWNFVDDKALDLKYDLSCYSPESWISDRGC